MRIYGSIDEAKRAFDRYAHMETRLRPLWDLCGEATPPRGAPAYVQDAYDSDPYESDPLAADKPADGWCAEDFFLDHVKSKLLLLAGDYRSGPLHELHSREAFEDIYDLLLNWALHRPCTCCATRDRDEPRRHDDRHADSTP